MDPAGWLQRKVVVDMSIPVPAGSGDKVIQKCAVPIPT